MKFCWSTIFVTDLEQSLQFYQEIIGLSLNQRFTVGAAKEIAFLGDGETKVELIYHPEHQATGPVEGISLGFAVESVDQMLELIKEKGLVVHSGPHQPNPHIKYFYVKDPNGISIQFVETIK